MNTVKPNLFIVGQPKSGTTALQFFLKQHPDVFMCSPKEPMFFCKDAHQMSRAFHGKKWTRYVEFRDLNAYLNLFEAAGNRRIVGEATTCYLYSRTAASEIHEFAPNAKIIAIFREPVDCIYSLYCEYRGQTEETAPNFQAALELEALRKKGQNIPPRVRCPSWLFYSERVKYTEQLRRFLTAFSRDQVMVIVFDDFRRDNLGVYKNVLEFLNLDTVIIPHFRDMRESRVPCSQWLNNAVRNPAVKALPKWLLPPRIYDRIQLGVQRILMKREKRPPLDTALRERLMRRFKPEIEAFSGLLDRDLVGEWGYDKI
jgi:hypothetical protein